MATLTFSKTLTLNVIECANCNVPFAITEDLERRLRESHRSFYCPNGHSNVYEGKNEAERLRDELKRKEQELANASIRKIEIQNELDSANNKLKRLTNGVCPCCNRSFKNLRQHMSKQHPDHVSKKR